MDQETVNKGLGSKLKKILPGGKVPVTTVEQATEGLQTMMQNLRDVQKVRTEAAEAKAKEIEKLKQGKADDELEARRSAKMAQKLDNFFDIDDDVE